LTKTAKLLNQLVRGENFPHYFLKEASKESLTQAIVQESPHPLVAFNRSLIV